MVVVKTFSIVVDGRENIFSSSTDKIEQREAKITPRRGEILDAKSTPLITSVAFYDVYMDPKTVKKEVWDEHITELSKGLAELLEDKTAREYEEYLRSARAEGRRYVLIQKKMSNDTRRKIRKLPIFNLGRFKGG